MAQGYSRDTLIVRAQVRDLAGINELHVALDHQAVPHMLLEERTALHQSLDRGWNWFHPCAKSIPTNVRNAQRNGSIPGECGKEVGKEFSQDRRSPCQERMRVPSLRDAFARLNIIRKFITFDNCYLLKMIG